MTRKRLCWTTDIPHVMISFEINAELFTVVIWTFDSFPTDNRWGGYGNCGSVGQSVGHLLESEFIWHWLKADQALIWSPNLFLVECLNLLLIENFPYLMACQPSNWTATVPGLLIVKTLAYYLHHRRPLVDYYSENTLSENKFPSIHLSQSVCLSLSLYIYIYLYKIMLLNEWVLEE